MGKRKRITNEIRGVVVEDPLEYIPNRSSSNARKVHSNAESVEFEIWFDQHYYLRNQLGDEDGKREGIEPESVQSLIVKAAKHLLYYSIKVRDFSFVNFSINGRSERVVLTLVDANNPNLNIIVEYHYLSINRYEVTLITALRKDAFHFSDGQYQVEIEEDDASTLYKKERGKIRRIDDYL